MKSIFVEFLEIYIIQVIYLRGLYPRQIFRKHKAYCLPVYCSIYPPLNDYLKGALKSIQHLLEIKQLNKIEILIYNEDDSRESFVINILEEFSIADTDKYLMKLHELFRQSIYNLDIKVKALSKFKRSSRFKILLHTKEKAYQKLCIDSKYQDFLFIKIDDDDVINKSEETRKIVPVLSAASNLNFMSLHIEEFK